MATRSGTVFSWVSKSRSKIQCLRLFPGLCPWTEALLQAMTDLIPVNQSATALCFFNGRPGSFVRDMVALWIGTPWFRISEIVTHE